MPLKVVVELQVHAVTCPGVFLPDKNDIFLNVYLLGQCKETRCLPAVFPLLFHEKMRFEKVFQKHVDPAAVADILEKHAAGFELIQIGDSGENVLATYKENHRDFLFPEPKLTPPYPGVDREVLMKTVDFPGIAPKVEFSSRTTIKEMPKEFPKKCSSKKVQSQRSLSNSPNRKSRSPAKSCSSIEKLYSSPTRSSKSRSPSPYSHRRMCELSQDKQQRLANLNLSNNEFKSDTDTKPPFLVRHVDQSKPVGEKDSSQLQSPKSKHHSSSGNQLSRALTFDNLCYSTPTKEDHLDLDDLYIPRKDFSCIEKSTSLNDPLSFSTHSLYDLRTSPALKGSFSERRRSNNNTWESIHSRVRNLLSTHSARQLLSIDMSESEADHILERSSKRSFSNSLEDRYLK
ncbi:spermatogenesis associated 6-like protein isoform X2 [Hyperolius riggenbachi]|uniref:spermatogenesis associated 6-like protein isoform X2 n=1 Tax=Hyperolius riggenbachi TaxID=752182 RepID=UPI0035A26E21